MLKRGLPLVIPFLILISRPEIGCHQNNLKDRTPNIVQKET